MARKRMIDPSIWHDENFGKLSITARLLFIGLFSNADDHGRIRANDSYIRSTIFMYDDISLTDVRQAVDEVAEKIKTIKSYEVSGNRYIQLLKWSEYQKQREDRMSDSLLPPPPQTDVRQMSDTCQTNVRQTPAEVKLSKLSKVKLDKNEVKEREVKERKPLSANADPISRLRETVQRLKGGIPS